MSMPHWGPNAARAVGVVLVVAACVFVARRLMELGLWTVVMSNGPVLLMTILLGAAAYGASGFLAAAAWHKILRWCGQNDAPARLCYGIYARSQIAKYIPGNVFHFIGRHMAGRRHGLGHAELICATVLESVALVSAATVLTLVGFSFWHARDLGLPIMVLAAGTVLALTTPLAVSLVLPAVARTLHIEIPSRRPRELLIWLLPAYLLHISFFVAMGCILWLIASALGGVPATLLPALTAAAAGTWAIGYLTPGAAAGIGVREALLIAALSGVLGIPHAAIIAIGFRIATLIGDLLFLAMSFALMSTAADLRWHDRTNPQADERGRT